MSSPSPTPSCRNRPGYALAEVLVAATLFLLVGGLGTTALILATRRLPGLTQNLLGVRQELQALTLLRQDLAQTPPSGLSVLPRQLVMTPVVSLNLVDQGVEWQCTQLLFYQVQDHQLQRQLFAQFTSDRPRGFVPEELSAWLSAQQPSQVRHLLTVEDWTLLPLPDQQVGCQLRLQGKSRTVEFTLQPNLELGR